jgi:DNA (cytosine-5)-methyltransferase 1
MEINIKVGSDFSGVGAFDQALLRLGINYKTIFACDQDKFARTTYAANYGTENDILLAKEEKTGVKSIISNIEKYSKSNKFSFYFPKDVYEREIPKESLDIYMTSPPCQAFSLAGKRLGKNDPKGRGILFFNSLEFIEKNKPRYFIFENVKGLLSDDGGKTFNEWLNYLGGKSVNGTGAMFPIDGCVPYHIYWKVLNAKDYGVPQNRERVFILGIRDDKDSFFNFPKVEPLTKRLKDVLEAEVEEKYYLSEKMLSGLKCDKHLSADRINNSLRCGGGSSIDKKHSFDLVKVGFINQYSQASQVYDSEGLSPNLCAGTHGYANGYIQEPKIIGYTRDEKGNVTKRYLKDVSGTIHTSSGGGGNTDQFVLEPKICAMRGRNIENPKSRKSGQPTQQMIEVNENGVSNSLTTVQKDNLVICHSLFPRSSKTGKGGTGHLQKEDGTTYCIDTECTQAVETQGRIRKLTPIEAFRLMDFPDSLVENARKAGVSDSQLYKQAGNSIVVAVLEKIIKNLKL